MHIRIHPSTRKALATLVGHAIERLVASGDRASLQTLGENARSLKIESPDGRLYSGVLVIDENRVAAGAVAPRRVDVPALSAGDEPLDAQLVAQEARPCRT